MIAIENFRKLPNISTLDLAFFLEDYNARLRGKFNSLDDELKSELFDLFNFVWAVSQKRCYYLGNNVFVLE